jgi:hypothetical protein
VVETELLVFLNLGGAWSASRCDNHTPIARAPSTHSMGVWLGLRHRLDILDKRIYLSPPEFYPYPGSDDMI